MLQPPLIEPHQRPLLEPLRLHKLLPEFASQQPLLKHLQQDNQQPPLLTVHQHPEQPET